MIAFNMSCSNNRDGYSTADINYKWHFKTPTSSPVSIADEVTLPQFSITNVSFTDKLQQLTTGNYSRLACKFNFRRNIGFYLIQLIVIISWVSFWLSRDATPARVTLGITTVLTMTTLMTTTNAALPKVSYIKSIDIYLITCYSMVFAGLLEYAAVCYLSKIAKRRREKRTQLLCNRPMFSAVGPSYDESSVRQSRQPGSFYVKQPAQPQPPDYSSGGTHKQTFAKFGLSYQSRLSGDDNQAAYFREEKATPAESESRLRLRSSTTGAVVDESPKLCTCDWEKKSITKLESLQQRKKPKSTKEIAISASTVDKYSRIFFPICFLVFNGLYWGIYLQISQYAIDDEQTE